LISVHLWFRPIACCSRARCWRSWFCRVCSPACCRGGSPRAIAGAAGAAAFSAAGKGTLAPWDPPRRLVVVGLYRFTRNPMYVGVLTLVLGWTLLLGSPWLAAYVVVLAAVFHLRTVLYEEPHLARLFGVEWERYRAAVPRWLPRRPREP
jgi:protein-S-isoprenylcysteine O-methyltransferase Ste14